MADGHNDGLNEELVGVASGDQLRAADPGKSVWVSANAGTGKTHTLTSRVARLLLNGTPPEKILCLTFTRAAAAQMQTKLYERLGTWSTLPDEALQTDLFHLEGRPLDADSLARARRLFARALETPGGLKIQTIHAFCESLLGRFPLEAGVSPHFELADDRTSTELLSAARNRVLERAADAPGSDLGTAVAGVVHMSDGRALADLLGEVTGHRRHLRMLVRDSQGMAALERRIAGRLDIEPDASEAGLIAAAAAATDLGAARRAAAHLRTGKKTDKTLAKAIESYAADPSPERWLDTYCPGFLTREGTARKNLPTMDTAAAASDIADWVADEGQRLATAVSARRSAATYAATRAVLRLGEAVIAEYEAEKTRRGYIDYDDLIDRAGDLLSSREATQWVLYKLDRGVDHILVDEAQDTSPAQWRVIEALAQEFFSGESARESDRTLFVVGDEKQSIFSFQGAVPGTFDEKRRQFARWAQEAGKAWDDVDLTISWRSVPQVLAGVDRVFGNAAVRAGVVADMREIVHTSVRTGAAGRIEIWPPVCNDETEKQALWDAPLDAVSARSATAKLAARIANKLHEWIGHTILPRQQRKMHAGDVLILVRRRNALVDELIRQLKRRHIPVAGIDRLVLTGHIAVQDLLALARFALLPEDDLTLATVLRSPFCDVSEEDLFHLAHGRRTTLWQRIREAGGPDARFLEDVLRRADFAPPHDFFARILSALGGRARLTQRLGADAHDPIDEFLNQALAYERHETPSLQGFVAWMEGGNTQVKRDLDQNRPEVRIMTAHGAKGLEANVVILPDTMSTRTGSHDRLIVHPDGLVTVTPGAEDLDSISSAARDAHKIREMEEYRRLLYVAMTRARDRLYIAGYYGKSPDKGNWYEVVHDALQPLAQEVTETFDEGDEKNRRPVEETVLRLNEEPKVDGPKEKESGPGDRIVLPAWHEAAAPRETEATRIVAPSHLGEEGAKDAPALSPLAGGGARRFARGRLIHALLQHLPDMPTARRADAAAHYLARAGTAFDAAAREEMLREVLRILDDAAFSPLFAPGSRAEVPLAGIIGWQGSAIRIAGQVDRLAVRGGDVLIADYKTNRPPPARVEAVATAYLDQMAAYRALAQATWPGARVRCALVWTDGPMLMDLPADLLDARGARPAA